MTLLDIRNGLGDSLLLSKIQAAAIKLANDVLNEAPETPLHADRVSWAKTVLGGDSMAVAQRMLGSCLTNPTVQSLGGQVTDNDLEFVVSSFINRFAANSW